MPCAMPSVKGFIKAPAKPAEAPKNGTDMPIRESYFKDIDRGINIGIKINTSSDIPKVAPPKENNVMLTGIYKLLRPGCFINIALARVIAAVIAPVFSIIINAPPMIKRKAIISAVVERANDCIGAFKTSKTDCGEFSI